MKKLFTLSLISSSLFLTTPQAKADWNYYGTQAGSPIRLVDPVPGAAGIDSQVTKIDTQEDPQNTSKDQWTCVRVFRFVS